jgi:hypothetical protein
MRGISLRLFLIGLSVTVASVLIPAQPASATIFTYVGYAYHNYNDVYARENTIAAWMNKDTGAHVVRAYSRNTEFSSSTHMYVYSYLTNCTGTSWCGSIGTWATTNPLDGYYDVTNYTPTVACTGMPTALMRNL